MDKWVPDDELKLLTSQPTYEELHGSRRSDEAITAAIFRDNAPLAAEVICHLAVNGEKEGTRLNASKYVVDRVLGRIGDKTDGSGENFWEDLFGSVTREPTADERKNGARVSRLQQ